MAPQLTRRKGPAARRERLWIARATTSLPEPVSPKISTGTSDWLTCATRSITSRSPDSAPTINSVPSGWPRRVSSDWRSARAASYSVRI